MSDTGILSTEVVNVKLNKAKTRLKELDGVIQKAQEEKGHIEYMLGQFSEEGKSPTKALSLDRRKVYMDVFEQNHDKSLHSSEILELLKEKGFEVKKPTHHANLSQFDHDPDMPIERVRVGYYKYNPNKNGAQQAF